MPKIISSDEYLARDLKKLDGSLDTFMSRLLSDYAAKGLTKEEIQERLNKRWNIIINYFVM